MSFYYLNREKLFQLMYSKEVIKLKWFIYYFWFVICDNFQKKLWISSFISKYKFDLRKRQEKNEVEGNSFIFYWIYSLVLLIKFHWIDWNKSGNLQELVWNQIF